MIGRLDRNSRDRQFLVNKKAARQRRMPNDVLKS